MFAQACSRAVCRESFQLARADADRALFCSAVNSHKHLCRSASAQTDMSCDNSAASTPPLLLEHTLHHHQHTTHA